MLGRATSSSTSHRHGLQRASKASEGSHCSKISVRRRVQKNFQGIKYTMETQVKTVIIKWRKYGTTVTLPRTGRPSKIDDKTRRKLVREAAKTADSNIEGGCRNFWQ
ncbi:hypothetical protein L3Q82_022462, partial [Scortum barcoo]